MTRTSWRGQEGVTLTEVLVATLILGVLVSIALPAFASQRSKAHGASAKTQARTARTAIETHYTERQSYVATASELVALEPALAEARNLQVSGTVTTFEVSVDDARGITFGVRMRGTGAIERFCAPAGTGSCPAGGRW